MNRRKFAKTLSVGAIMLATSKVVLSDEKPQLAITIDDFNLFGASPEIARKRNRVSLALVAANTRKRDKISVSRGQSWTFIFAFVPAC